MEKEIKTISDVLQVPQTECIQTVDFRSGLCPFCGAKLPYKAEVIRIKRGGFIRSSNGGVYRRYMPCSCPVALAALGHNNIARALQKEAFLREGAEHK